MSCGGERKFEDFQLWFLFVKKRDHFDHFGHFASFTSPPFQRIVPVCRI